MKKLSPIILLCLLSTLTSGIAAAFAVDDDLETQIGTYSQTKLNASGELTLDGDTAELLDFSLSPDFVNDRRTYLTTSKGLYRSSSYEGSFEQDSGWATEIKEMPFKAVFAGNYQDSGSGLLYDGNKVYISYNSGNDWSPESLGTDADVSEVFTGPDFANFHRLYYITDNSLYARDLSGSSTWQVMAGTSSDQVTDFGSPESSLSSNIFYVVKGQKIYKTVDGGSTWIDYDAGAEISQFVVAEDDNDIGIPLIVSNNNHLQAGDGTFNFYDLSVPSGVTQIYDLNYFFNGDQDYVIATDKGIYYTFDHASSWQKVPYTTTDFSGISGLSAITENADTSIFFILDNVLYRDVYATGAMTPYMTGVSATSEYAASGSAESKNIVELSGQAFEPSYSINEATLWADGMTNGQTLDLFMTVDGTHWEEVTSGELHTFANTGNALQWKAEMATTDTAVTPVLKTVMVDFGFDVGAGGTCAGFSDVQATDANCAAITYVKNQGIFSGYPDGTFKPDQAINRAETVKVITEGFDVPMLADPDNKLGFSDVILHEWYMPYLATAKAEGIIQGYPDGTFKPEQTVNYVELIKIFFETAEVALPGVPAGSEWYQPYLTYAQDNDYLVYSTLDAGMKRGDVARLFFQHSQK